MCGIRPSRAILRRPDSLILRLAEISLVVKSAISGTARLTSEWIGWCKGRPFTPSIRAAVFPSIWFIRSGCWPAGSEMEPPRTGRSKGVERGARTLARLTAGTGASGQVVECIVQTENRLRYLDHLPFVLDIIEEDAARAASPFETFRLQHFMGLAMAGCNIIHVAIGNLEKMRLASFEACLIADEILGATYRFLQGCDCGAEAIGLDAFRETRHASRFLEARHSLRFVRSAERWEPKLTDRNSWATWQARAGGKDMRERANERARRILEAHRPAYVTPEQAEEIDQIATEAQRYFLG